MYTIYIIGRYNTVLSCTHQSIQSLYRNRMDLNKYSTSCSIINTKEMCCTAHAVQHIRQRRASTCHAARCHAAWCHGSAFWISLTFQLRHLARLSNQSVTWPVLLMQGTGFWDAVMTTLEGEGEGKGKGGGGVGRGGKEEGERSGMTTARSAVQVYIWRYDALVAWALAPGWWGWVQSHSPHYRHIHTHSTTYYPVSLVSCA